MDFAKHLGLAGFLFLVGIFSDSVAIFADSSKGRGEFSSSSSQSEKRSSSSWKPVYCRLRRGPSSVTVPHQRT